LLFADGTKADLASVKAAFDLINRSRRLPVMLETFLGSCPAFLQWLKLLTGVSDEICKQYHLITRDIEQYLAEYEVSRLAMLV
jgi:hypothetical protein